VFAVNLSNKQLQGTIPSSSLGQLALLSSLNLSGNVLSGPITAMLQQTGSFPSLVSLDLSNNNLTGALPDSSSLASLHNLSFFDASNNDLHGPIPSQLFSLPGLQSLDLSRNSFNGSISTALNLSSSPQLQNLDLSDNQLSGNISADFLANLTSLVSLDLSRNPLGGVIPATVGQLIHLQSLQLTSCNLIGSIPQELYACVELQELKLNENSLQGDIPRSLGALPQLSSLDLSSNLLEGDFLSFIANTSILQELLLSDNHLSGVIPSSVGTSLQKLTHSLSLSHNQLSGPIPEQLGDLVLVQNLDFSFNNLSGSIPESIGNCSSLLSLIISHNRLEGSIPPQLGNLTKLTQLDLSDNDLSGSIPASLTTISTLSFLNVSYNNLQGLIPNFTHQGSNNNITALSFLNNPGLCGVIINKECQSSSHDTRNKILLGAIVGGFGLLLLLLLVVSCCCCYCRRKSRGSSKSGSKFSASVSDELQLRLSAEEILLATGGFGEANIIGRGLTSTIYRGVYNDVDVAVKRLTILPSPPLQQQQQSPDVSEAGPADAAAVVDIAPAAVDVAVEPDTELETLASVRHNSLVRVVGYCSSPEIKALVLEYMPNGSLENLLHPSPGAEVVQTFNWNARLNVAIGVAQGLAYLHHERAATTPLVHGNVKPSNILFDAKWRARISDFGMSTILAPGAGASGGASGYIPPGNKESILTIFVIQPSSCCQSSSKNCITIQTFFSVFSQE
jgi:LRR receptor-like serine/threonine-protein kinase FLS2